MLLGQSVSINYGQRERHPQALEVRARETVKPRRNTKEHKEKSGRSPPHARGAWLSGCTVSAAVTSAALDSDAKTSAEYGVRGKIPAEDFHTTKSFVLGCGTGSAFELR